MKKIILIIIIIFACLSILISIFQIGHNSGYKKCLSHIHTKNIDLWLSYSKEHISLQRLGPYKPPILFEAEIVDNVSSGHKININLGEIIDTFLEDNHKNSILDDVPENTELQEGDSITPPNKFSVHLSDGFEGDLIVDYIKITHGVMKNYLPLPPLLQNHLDGRINLNQ